MVYQDLDYCFSNGCNGHSLQENASSPKSIRDGDVPFSPANGRRLRLAYQGVPGAFSEAAALKAFLDCEPVPCEQFETVFEAVEQGLVDRAILPFENSLGGCIHRNYDLLLCHNLHIVGEVQLAVHHCLLVLPGVKKEDLKRVISHPQALLQCEQSLNHLGVAREAADNTARSAQFIVANNFRDTGAIASARAAKIYGLHILADGIQDDSDNVTRFLILGREPVIPHMNVPFKTSVVFALQGGPGFLCKALTVFSLRDINLAKIESRPRKNQPLRLVDYKSEGTKKQFDYIFYIDFEASMADSRAQKALSHLQEFAAFVRVLGSYPRDMTL